VDGKWRRALAVFAFVSIALAVPLIVSLSHKATLPSESTVPLQVEGSAAPGTPPPFDLRRVAVIVKTGESVGAERLKPLVDSGVWLTAFDMVLVASDSGKELWPGCPLTVFDAVKGGARVEQAKAAVHNDVEHEQRFAAFNARQLFAKKRNSGIGAHTDAWAQDRLKNIPAVVEAFRLFPNASFYLMIDDDTFLSARNLAAHLADLHDDDVGIYQGNAMGFTGCGATDATPDWKKPLFAHGGSGILMSHTAVKRMVEFADPCLARYYECWAGDVMLALCLATLSPPIKVASANGFHSETVSGSMHRIHGHWCNTPMTFHHLTVDEHLALLAFERLQFETLGRFSLPAAANRFFIEPLIENATLALEGGDVQCTENVVNDGEPAYATTWLDIHDGPVDKCWKLCRTHGNCMAVYVDIPRATCELYTNVGKSYTPFVAPDNDTAPALSNGVSSYFCLSRSVFFGHLCGII
jgi:hypothetical protein